MICDHGTIKKTTTEAQFTLVYCGTKALFAKYTSASTESRHTTETFETIQELIDRGLSLGLTCGINYLIKALEHGAVLPQDVMDDLLAVVWESGRLNAIRMEALGHVGPKLDVSYLITKGK